MSRGRTRAQSEIGEKKGGRKDGVWGELDDRYRSSAGSCGSSA